MSGRPRGFDDEAVIEAAMEVFWSNGYEATSAQDLVERTGLGRGSLYNAFGSKQGLYHEALKRYQEQALQAQLEILGGPGSLKERLRNLMLWGLESDLDPVKRRGCMALFAVLERASKDPEVAQISRLYANRLEQALCHAFAVGQRNGEVTAAAPPLSLARAFQGSYYGLRVLGRSVQDRAVLLDVIESTLALF